MLASCLIQSQGRHAENPLINTLQLSKELFNHLFEMRSLSLYQVLVASLSHH
jgi:hypothetical protein